MGPDLICLELARDIKLYWPSISADEYALAYFIQSFCERNELAKGDPANAS